jgi:erythromycin esterase-like protein
LTFNIKDSLTIKEKKNEREEFTEFYLSKFPNNQKLRMTNVNQWCEKKLNKGFTGNFRDSCMANNIAAYLQNNPEIKEIYFAHNGHTHKTKRRYEE